MGCPSLAVGSQRGAGRTASERLAIAMAESFVARRCEPGDLVPSTIEFVERNRSIPLVFDPESGIIRKLLVLEIRFVGDDGTRNLKFHCFIRTAEIEGWCVWLPLLVEVAGHQKLVFEGNELFDEPYPVEREILQLEPLTPILTQILGSSGAVH